MQTATHTTSFRLRKDVAARFREAVFRKHGTLYGALQQEMTRAIEDRTYALEEELSNG